MHFTPSEFTFCHGKDKFHPQFDGSLKLVNAEFGKGSYRPSDFGALLSKASKSGVEPPAKENDIANHRNFATPQIKKSRC